LDLFISKYITLIMKLLESKNYYAACYCCILKWPFLRETPIWKGFF